MKRLTEREIERGVAALIPYVQEWGLPLNPENLQAMAVAVLIHAYSDETFDEIDAAERERINEDREAHQRMEAAMAEALEKRRGPEPRLPSGALTEAELTIIEGRAAAATPGPWKSFLEGRDHFSGADFIRTGGLDTAYPDLYLRHDLPDQTNLVPAPIEDQDFVAHARQDVPRLVAEVRRLREVVAQRPPSD